MKPQVKATVATVVVFTLSFLVGMAAYFYPTTVLTFSAGVLAFSLYQLFLIRFKK